MKKLLLIGILFSTFSSLHAQNKTSFGIGAGINIANVSDNYNGESHSYTDKVGFKGYVFADMQLAKYFSIETDLGYDGMGFKFDDQSLGSVSQAINYLTLSILPKIHIKQSGIAFFGGPALGFKLNSVVSGNGNSVSNSDSYTSMDVFGVIGMEYFSPVGLGISFRVMPGFTNIVKDTGGDESVHNVVIGFSLAY